MHLTKLALLFLLMVAPAHASGASLTGLMPESVGDLHRIQLVSGDLAQAEVDKLHGKELAAEASIIGRYSRPEDVGKVRPAEVWISRVSSEKEARRQTGLMVHKMFENPRSPFRNPGRTDHGGIGVYHFEGMGQVHLIWYRGDLVYWISCAPGDQASFLDVFCR